MPTKIAYLIIEHIPTGKVLPARASRQGFTHDDPMFAEDLILGPRLFTKYATAERALKAYCLGPWTCLCDLSGTFNISNSSFKVETAVKPDRSLARNIAEFQVKPLTMEW
jgi:hypothetical protein